MVRLQMLAVLYGGLAMADPLQIAVHDHLNTGTGVVQDAVFQIQRIFRLGKMNVELVHDDGGVVGRAGCRRGPDVAVEIMSAPATLEAGVLGMALANAKPGPRALIFADHVRDAAIRENVPYAVVLAYAISHEVGHLLMGNGSHVSYGLMAAVWTRHEYQRMSSGAVLFTGEQSRQMRSSLGPAQCDPQPYIPPRPNVELSPINVRPTVRRSLFCAKYE